MEKIRISVVSGAALLALTATASAGPMTVPSAQVISPPIQIEPTITIGITTDTMVGTVAGITVGITTDIATTVGTSADTIPGIIAGTTTQARR